MLSDEDVKYFREQKKETRHERVFMACLCLGAGYAAGFVCGGANLFGENGFMFGPVVAFIVCLMMARHEPS